MEGRGRSLEDEEKRSLVETFLGITASTREEALFFLESHDWVLDSAILSFYDDNSDSHQHRQHQDHDDDPNDQDEDYIPQEVAAPAAVPPPRVTRSTGAAAAPTARVTRSSATTAALPGSSTAMGSRGDKKPSKPSGSRPTIRTLADLNRSSDPGSDSDSDGPQEYYTGGEKSGMLVQDPSKGGNDVDAIFEQARQMGAMQGPFEPQQSSSSRSFAGTGRLLTGESVPPAPQQPENVVHNIYFWRNGFTVNDGPLRRFDDPENASFLESIRKSECPKELEPADRRSMVNVNLIRREENCPEPARRLTPFQGVGRTLAGGSSDSSVTEPTVDNTVSSAVPSSFGLSVDDSMPSTSIQLRLADGTRMVARFNTHHTIGDIREFIDASRPGSARTYQLQTVGFPPKQLNDLSKTIEEAGLANSVIIQKG
ncbi:unnamed protein product [Musa textilis]